MSLVIPPGFASAALVFNSSQGTQPFVTTIGVDVSDAGGDYVAVADKVMSDYGLAFNNQWSSSLVLDRCTLTVGADGPSGSVDSTLSPIPSTRSGAFPPVAMAAIARKVTNRLGRQGRGRMFLPAVLSESEVDEDGSIINTRRTSLTQQLNLFHELLTDSEGLYPFTTMPVLLHGPSVVLNPPDPIVGFALSDTVGWIRGRIR